MTVQTSEDILAFGSDREPTKAAAKPPCPGPEFCIPDEEDPHKCKLCGDLIYFNLFHD